MPLFINKPFPPLKPLVFCETCWVFPPSCSDSMALRFWEHRLRFLARTNLIKLAKLTRGLHCSFKRIFKCILTHLMCWQRPVSFQETERLLKGSPCRRYPWSCCLWGLGPSQDLAVFLALSRCPVVCCAEWNLGVPAATWYSSGQKTLLCIF